MRSQSRGLPPGSPLLPSASVYDMEAQLWPWGMLLQEVVNWVSRTVPREGMIFDVMCGTGWLLRQLQDLRPDLVLIGLDSNSEYVEYARSVSKGIEYRVGDARDLAIPSATNTVIVTGGVHHFHWNEQAEFLASISSQIVDMRTLIVGEAVIGGYSNECSRKRQSLTLGKSVVDWLIDRESPDSVISAAIDVLHNDILAAGEYKLTLDQIMSLLACNFEIEEVKNTWRASEDSGDYLFFCRRPPRLYA